MRIPLKIVIATRNLGKFREIKQILAGLPIQFQSTGEFPSLPKAEESGSTYLENAREKARIIAELCQTWALADDSGLEVEGLAWQPGVRASRYAGEDAGDGANIQKMLKELSAPHLSRRAVFRCTMVLKHPDGQEFVTEGELWGEILQSPQGSSGFGYDPVFFVPEKGKTLAQMGEEEKNRISHRTQALKKLIPTLQALISKSPSD